jgi:ferritin-like metal-binding protein YciE
LNVSDSPFAKAKIWTFNDSFHTQLSDEYPLEELARGLLQKFVRRRKEMNAVDAKFPKELLATIVPG